MTAVLGVVAAPEMEGRWIASGYVVQALAPSFFRRQLKKHTLRDD